jgi:hypothetical protein
MANSPQLRRRWTQTRAIDDHSFFDCPFVGCKVCESLERKANRELLAYGFCVLIVLVAVFFGFMAMIRMASQRNAGEMLRPLPVPKF